MNNQSFRRCILWTVVYIAAWSGSFNKNAIKSVSASWYALTARVILSSYFWHKLCVATLRRQMMNSLAAIQRRRFLEETKLRYKIWPTKLLNKLLNKNLDCSITLINSDNLLLFKFSKFYLKGNFVNNCKKFECLQISKFLPFKMIWSWSFDKIISGSNFVNKFGTF